jgi:hypothetical protein
MRDIGHPVLARAENTDSWHARSGDLQRAFPLDIRTVPSSAINITTDGECLTCVGFSFGETVRLGSFEFIADNFGGLSFSPRRGDLSVTFMGSTHSGTPSPWWAMIEDSIEEFLTVSSNEGGLQSPLSQEAPHGGSAYSHRNHTWTKITPATQATTTVPLQMAAPWPDTGLPFKQCHTLFFLLCRTC